MLRKCIHFFVLTAFLCSNSPQSAQAQGLLGLPEPGTLVGLSRAYQPALIKGVRVDANNPFLFNFIMDTGHSGLQGDGLRLEGDRLIRYFFAALTIPEKDLWVNLSPYEKDRMVPAALGDTAMGRDLLAQDYMLKQVTASLIYPEKELGKNFWDKIYAQARAQLGTAIVPVNTFNKVWIVAERAKVFERGQTAFIADAHLKVMLEEDYLAAQAGTPVRSKAAPAQGRAMSSVVRQVILPAIEEEVNEGKNFATLRQIFYSQILATWYKRALKQALLSQVYADKSTVKGVDLADPAITQKIYARYLEAYKKGAFNFIKEERDPAAGRVFPRKYFSGGYDAHIDSAMVVSHKPGDAAQAAQMTGGVVDITAVVNTGRMDAAMSGKAAVREIRIPGDAPEGTQAFDEMIVRVDGGNVTYAVSLLGRPKSAGVPAMFRMLEGAAQDVKTFVEQPHNNPTFGGETGAMVRSILARAGLIGEKSSPAGYVWIHEKDAALRQFLRDFSKEISDVRGAVDIKIMYPADAARSQAKSTAGAPTARISVAVPVPWSLSSSVPPEKRGAIQVSPQREVVEIFYKGAKTPYEFPRKEFTRALKTMEEGTPLSATWNTPEWAIGEILQEWGFIEKTPEGASFKAEPFERKDFLERLRAAIDTSHTSDFSVRIGRDLAMIGSLHPMGVERRSLLTALAGTGAAVLLGGWRFSVNRDASQERSRTRSRIANILRAKDARGVDELIDFVFTTRGGDFLSPLPEATIKAVHDYLTAAPLQERHFQRLQDFFVNEPQERLDERLHIMALEVLVEKDHSQERRTALYQGIFFMKDTLQRDQYMAAFSRSHQKSAAQRDGAMLSRVIGVHLNGARINPALRSGITVLPEGSVIFQRLQDDDERRFTVADVVRTADKLLQRLDTGVHTPGALGLKESGDSDSIHELLRLLGATGIVPAEAKPSVALSPANVTAARILLAELERVISAPAAMPFTVRIVNEDVAEGAAPVPGEAQRAAELARDPDADRRFAVEGYGSAALRRAQPGQTADAAMNGGIDLNTLNAGLQVSTDANGGVIVHVDPALNDRIRREGIKSATPVIIHMRLLPSVMPLLGLEAPQDRMRLAKV